MSNLKGLANLTCLMRCHFQGFTHFKDPHHLPGKDSSLPLEVKGAINSKARARTVDPDSPGVPKGCRLPLSWSEMRRRFASTCSFTNLNKWLLISKYKIQIINIYIYINVYNYIYDIISGVYTLLYEALLSAQSIHVYTRHQLGLVRCVSSQGSSRIIILLFASTEVVATGPCDLSCHSQHWEGLTQGGLHYQ